MVYKEFKQYIKTLDKDSLKQEAKENKQQIINERKKKKINQNTLKILSLEAKQQDYNMELVRRRNLDYEQQRRKKELR